MTPQDIIQDVRDIIQDTDETNYRYANNVLLRFVNQTIKRMVSIRPDLFIRHADISTTPNQVEQIVPASLGSYRLVDIFRVAGADGKAIEEVDRPMFNRMDANWTADPPGVPTKFMRHPKNPNRYFLYPRPEPGIEVVAEYVTVPPNRQLGDTIITFAGSDMSTAYWSALVDGTVFLAESVDDEFVNNQRAKMFYDSFIAGLSIGVQSRALVDLDDATIPTQG